MPHSEDRTYSDLAIPQYEDAVRIAGGEPVRIELDLSPDDVRKQVANCDALLLPGSRADINPTKYGADRHEKTAASDAMRDTVDELLLRDAYHLHKPVLGICYGLQSLNVFRSGSLVQHIESTINHSAGRTVPNAHTVEVAPGSLLSEVVGSEKTLAVNSSHHQAAYRVGEGLRVVARSTEDGVIEALEGTAPRHFVLAVQWHPERSVKDGAEVAHSAKAIFHAFIHAARAKHAELASDEERVRSAKR